MEKRSFSERLAEERKKRGYTQKQIAEALGVSTQAVSKWETGDNEVDVSTLCRLAAFYEESPAVFFEEEKPDKDSVQTMLGELPPAEAAQRWLLLQYDAILGMYRSLKRTGQGRYGQAIRDLRPPRGLYPPDGISADQARTSAAVMEMDCPDLFGLLATGPDANLGLLILPHEEKYAWMDTEEERLQALFRVLAMPGAMKCLRFLLSQPNDRFFSAACLAEVAGIGEEEMAEFLHAAAGQLLCVPQRVRREGREEEILYRSRFRTELAGILTLARLMLPFRLGRDPIRYGYTIGWGGRLPEKEAQQ